MVTGFDDEKCRDDLIAFKSFKSPSPGSTLQSCLRGNLISVQSF